MWLDEAAVAVVQQQGLDVPLGCADGAGADAEQFGRWLRGQAEAQPQHGDQGLLGEGERGRVAAGGLAGGRAAAAMAELGGA
ncbi:MAG TPA: hypothetical protein VM782_24595, partial [Stellaceae bacterium]|nr:hypothetical protein [Stellaceae bacterium]